jgi:hypothetical protein
MTGGADKGFTFDPPGAIGLWFDDARVMLRLHESDAMVRPKDEVGALADLDVAPGGLLPYVVPAAMGLGKRFLPASLTALAAKDLAGGSSLVTRDCTVMAILSWDVAAQNTAGSPGTIVCRGADGSAAEYVAYQLSLSVVSAANRTGSIAWSWQDTAGATHAQTGAQFTCPTGFMLLTATRRWNSPTSVTSRYYIGDLLLGEVTSANGSIGGGVTGTFFLGAAGGAAPTSVFAGIIDELAVFDREMCQEEIEDTWFRITLYQPLGVQLFKEMHDPGFPQSNEPGSDVQLENRWVGMSLGFAASRIENIRRNLVPQRSYGQTLIDWETALRPTPQPGQSLDQRRERVVARLRQHLGSSIPGLQGMLSGLLGGADPSQLTFLAFSNTWTDGFATINALRWDRNTASAAAISAAGGGARFLPGAGTFTAPTTWISMRRSIDSAKQAQQIVKLVMTTPQSGLEAGIFFGDASLGNYILLGLRDVAGSFQIFTEKFAGGVSTGAAVSQATLGANPAALWLWLGQTTTDGTWSVQWSTTSATSGFTAAVNLTHPTAAQWAGCYLRSTGAIGAPQVDFDDHLLRLPYGLSPLNAWVVLDAVLGFSPDIPGSRQVAGTVKHSYVDGGFATTLAVTYDDPDNGYANAPYGGY